MGDTLREKSGTKPQEYCIDLPGEAVKCWRSSDKIKVILRKHRDVIFDINIKNGATYSIESTSEFYNPAEKKLMKKAFFFDGTPFHIWVGRNFKDSITLKHNDAVVGSYYLNALDPEQYGGDPKTKPEPFMVVIGKKNTSLALRFTNDDPYGIGAGQCLFKPELDPKLAALKGYGTKFDYNISPEQVDVKEYVAVTEALPHEIQSQVLKQLDAGVAVEGNVEQIFKAPKSGQQVSSLYLAIATAAANIAENTKGSSVQSVVNWIGDFVTSNSFKETAGYIQENYKRLSRVTMHVRIEKRTVGKYRVILKGRPLVRVAGRVMGIGVSASVVHENLKLGSEKTAFIDGGYGKTGRAGYGSVKRILLSSAEKFRAGMKIQVIGTVIDLVGDMNSVYFDEKGSKDLTEFLGRAGVSLLKAGATAVLGSIAAAIAAFALPVLFGGALTVGAIALVVVAGYIGAATLVDYIDAEFNIKENVANWAK